jgi:hypothetical protein
VGEKLERLSLTPMRFEHTTRQIDAWAMGETEDFTKYTPKLKELTLAAFDFEDLFESLSKIISFQNLTRLELLRGGPGGVQCFLGDLAEFAQSNKLCLEHIATHFGGDFRQGDHAAVTDSFSKIAKASEPLKSFHTSYPDHERMPIGILRQLAGTGLRQDLQSLGL